MVAFLMAIMASTTSASAQIEINNLAQPGAFEVVNRGPTVSVASPVKVQRLHNGAWVDATTDVELIDQCRPPPRPSCRDLQAGQTLRVLPWNGMSCGGQCPAGCRGNVYHGPGTFRFGVSACDGSWQQFGAPFQLGPWQR